MGTRKLAPGRDGASQAGALGRDGPSRPRPWQAVAVAETAGSRGAGGPVERPSRGSHGSLTAGTRIRDGSRTPSRRCRELHASSRVVRHARRRGRPEVRYPDERTTTDPRAEARSSLGPSTGRKVDRMLSVPRPRPPRATRGERACDVPGIFVADRAEVWDHSDGIVTEVRLRTVPVTPLPRKPHVPGASWGSQPARTPLRRPGPTSTAPRTAARARTLASNPPLRGIDYRRHLSRRIADRSGRLLAPRAVSRRPALLDCASTSTPEEESRRDQG